ncbi:MAG: hypothetical protein GX876_01295 [Bacteroidales bacterium]|nr:hypothetical protein [Bacteroidales bacterium]
MNPIPGRDFFTAKHKMPEYDGIQQDVQRNTTGYTTRIGVYAEPERSRDMPDAPEYTTGTEVDSAFNIYRMSQHYFIIPPLVLIFLCGGCLQTNNSLTGTDLHCKSLTNPIEPGANIPYLNLGKIKRRVFNVRNPGWTHVFKQQRYTDGL